MSAQPEQPVFYSPGPVPQDPNVQYVQPQQQQFQQTGTPAFEYVTPAQPGVQQPVYSPQVQPSTLQQPYYPAETPQLQNQQAYQPQPYQPQPELQQAPPVVYAAAHATSAMPVVTRGNGRGLTGKFHQFEQCCLCFPLHTGGLIITFLMVIFYGYCGLALLTSGFYAGFYNALLIVVGILYLGVAILSGYGFAGIYKEEPLWVDRYIRFFVIGSLVWAVLQIVQIAIVASYYARYDFGGGYWAGWIVTFLIGLGFQYYFCCCLVSYQRVLHARINGGDGETTNFDGGKVMQMN
ncbi:hypothetical protein EMPS_06633 [Entomortierella parvispora]|uniref:Uncharacterized protein n=1 Tax=Entomortierella parvispora TaxID=205924 RepID=A0A9P3LXX5_9FUNG|nr:hypothetical protein EMPS_06633 [Entomortierella parvispora]